MLPVIHSDTQGLCAHIVQNRHFQGVRALNSSDLRVAIVGCGGIAGLHISAIQEAGGARIVAVADCAEQAARAAGDRTGAKVYTDYDDMLAREQPDAVVVATPPNSHRGLTMAALEAGAHVLCEKPLAFNSFEAEEMVEAARAGGRILMTAFCHRFHEPVMKAKELIESGELGPIVMFRNRFGGKVDMSSTWFGSREIAGGGLLMDTAVHSIDLFRYLVGEVRNVSARTLYFNPSMTVEDTAIMLLESTGGVIGTIEGSWATPASANVIEVYGHSGAAFVDYADGLRYFTESAGDWIRPEMSKPDRFVLQMEHFLNCIREGKQPIVTGEDGLAAMKVIEAAYRSVERGCFEPPEITTEE